MRSKNSLPSSPDFDPLTLTRTDIAKLAERTLSEHARDLIPRDASYQDQIQREEQRRCDPTAMSNGGERCLKAICEYPEPIEFRCARLGCDREQEYAGRKEPEHRGYIQRAGSIGNKHDIWVPTPKGEAYARKQGWSKPSYKSGPLHEAVRQVVKISAARSFKSVRLFDKGFANVLGGIQPDLILQFQGGQLAVVQCCDRNQGTYEAKRLHELCGIEHVDLVISVAVNGATKRKLEKELHRQIGKVWPAKLITLDVEPLLDPNYDWSWIMEKGA